MRRALPTSVSARRTDAANNPDVKRTDRWAADDQTAERAAACNSERRVADERVAAACLMAGNAFMVRQAHHERLYDLAQLDCGDSITTIYTIAPLNRVVRLFNLIIDKLFD
jgi:hypothetical protein